MPAWSMLPLRTESGRDSLLSPQTLRGAMARTDASVSMDLRRRFEELASVMIEALSVSKFPAVAEA